MEEHDHICQQCGGTTRIEYTIGFEHGLPMDLRATPSTMLKLCPGHPNNTAASEWEQLSNEQKYSINKLRQRMQEHFLAETTAFYTRYHDVRLEWDFSIDAFLRPSEEPAHGS